VTFFSRVGDVWRVIVGKPTRGMLESQNDLVGAKSRSAALEMELREAKDTLETQRRRIEELEVNHQLNSSDHIETLLREAAAPLSQLRMQASLMDSGKEIAAAGVMVLASRLSDVLENVGMEPIGSTGDQIPYDSTMCEALSADSSFAEQEPVMVRFIGYRYKGVLLRKALVERST
jgi:molecular chaperone GrpE